VPATNAPSATNLQFRQVVEVLFLTPEVGTALQRLIDVGDYFAIAWIARGVLVEPYV
jgi:hypothetical protein